MKQQPLIVESVVKTSETKFEFCAKSAPVKEQLHNRAQWPIGKVEILLGGLRHLPILPEILDYTAGLFPSFNVEVGYSLDKLTPTDLSHVKSQDYILRVAELCKKHKNFDRLVMHLVGGSVVLDKDAGYQLNGRKLARKEEALDSCKKFINSLDSKGEFITLENTYPVDANSNGISLYPCGKVTEDFAGYPRVLDTAHLGISAVTYAEVEEKGVDPLYGTYSLSEVEVPVYLGPQGSPERKFGARVKSLGLTEAVIEQILENPSNIVEMHFCGNYNSDRRQQDGAGFEDNSAIDLAAIFAAVKKDSRFPKKLIFIPEVKEPDGDYVEARRQRAMMLKLQEMEKN